MLWLVVVLSLLSQIAPAAGFTVFDERLRQMYHNNTMWPVTVAAFGDQLASEKGASFDLMLPPADDVNGTLCSVPASLMNATAELWQSYTFPIGLFVAVGDCSPETKARTLLAIQEMVLRVNFLVVYGTDSRVAITQVIMLPDDMRNVEELQQLGAIYVPTDYGAAIMDRLQRHAAETRESPYFLDANNTEFSFRIDVQIDPNSSFSFDDNGSNPRGRQDSDDESYGESFIWFRFVLFALLIVAPCVRAAFLWYQGGGRFIWRRNDQGRIVGIQYIPPMPYWLAAGRFIPTNREAASFTLTEEQFANLPEIKYERLDPTERVADNGDGGGEDDGVVDENNEQSPVDGVDKPEIVVSTPRDSAVEAEKKETVVDMEGNDLEKQETSSLQNCLNSAQREEREPLEVVVTDDTPRQEDHGLAPLETTPPAIHDDEENPYSCTACSICIDDFEEGETLVLLPRCRHTFHKECLKPWLLERQGCCPLCKTEVLPSSEQETNDSTFSIVGDHQEEDREHSPSGANQRDQRNGSVSEDPTERQERIEL